MPDKRPSLVFFGNERLSSSTSYDRAPILEVLLRQGYEIEALVLSQQPTKSRSGAKTAALDMARKHNLPIFVVKNGTELAQTANALKSDWAVLASFGLLLRSEILKCFRSGIINIHPSLLPQHRGPTPIETALLEGDRKTGVSLMRVEEELDAGGVYAQAELAIAAGESKLSLTGRLAELAGRLLSDKLPLILEGKLETQEQNHDLATYTEKIISQAAFEFRSLDARYWERHIRAFAGCPNNKFRLVGQTVEVEKAELDAAGETGEDIAYDKSRRVLLARCRTGRLAISRLKPASRRSVTAEDFVNGLPRRLPDILV